MKPYPIHASHVFFTLIPLMIPQTKVKKQRTSVVFFMMLESKIFNCSAMMIAKNKSNSE